LGSYLRRDAPTNACFFYLPLVILMFCSRHFRSFVTKRQRLQFILNRNGKSTSLPIVPAKIVTKTMEPKKEDKELRGPRMYWYTDPYLLGSAISKLFLHAESKGVQSTIVMVQDLVLRHKGASNAQVFGLIFKHLSELKKYKEVFEFYDIAKERRLSLTDQGVSSLLNALAFLDMDKQKKIKLGKLIFDGSEKSPLHVSALLRVSTTCYDQGGIEYGIRSYLELISKRESKTEEDHTDIQLYTSLFSLLAKKPSANNNSMAKSIFLDMERKKKVDDQLLAAYLNILSKSSSAPQEALSLIGKYLKYPTSHKEQPLEPKKITVEVLTILLYIAAKLQYPSLAQRWVDLANLEMDTACGLALSDVYLQSGESDRAWELFEHYSFTNGKLNSANNEYGLRICAMGSTKSKNSSIWFDRAQQLIQDFHFSYRGMYNYLWVTFNNQQYEIGFEFLCNHKVELLDNTLMELETVLVEKNQIGSLLRLKLNGLKVIKRILNCHNGDDDNVLLALLLKKVKSIEEVHKIYSESSGSDIKSVEREPKFQQRKDQKFFNESNEKKPSDLNASLKSSFRKEK
jgi:hypothetical protein